MDTSEPIRQMPASVNGITILSERPPDWIFLALELFDSEMMLRKNPELIEHKFSAYPFLLHLIELLLWDSNWNLEWKKILEIGWGAHLGKETIQYLRKLTDTIEPDGKIEHHAWGIDERCGDSNFMWGVIEFSWENLLRMWESRWDCIFHHTIGPIGANPGTEKELKNSQELAEITHQALRPGGYYIAFRRLESDNIPLDEETLRKQGYLDSSFDFNYNNSFLGREWWYHATILQKPSGTDELREGVHGSIGWIIGQ